MPDHVATHTPAPSRTTEHLAFLDYFRCLAITMVFAYHAFGTAFVKDQLPWIHGVRDLRAPIWYLIFYPMTFGWAGVAIFFVVSGFCIHLSFTRNVRDGWKAFFLKRFFRIYPPYFVALLLFESIHRASLRTFLGRAQLGSHILLVNNFSQKYIWGINASFWSIAVEAQLYLLYPVLLLLVQRIGWKRALTLLLALEIILRAVAALQSLWLPPSIIPRMPEGLPFFYWYSWAIGAALANAWIEKKPLPFQSVRWPVWLALGAAAWFVQALAPFSFLFFSLMTVSLIAVLLNKPQLAHTHRPGILPFQQIGKFSYSFYLLHQPMIGSVGIILAKILGDAVNPLLVLACCFCTYPLICGVSWIFYHLEERSIALGKLFVRHAEHR